MSADNQLAVKLARRQMLIDTYVDDCADNPVQPSSPTTTTVTSSVIMNDNPIDNSELGIKFASTAARRHKGIICKNIEFYGRTCPSDIAGGEFAYRVSASVYAEFPEFSRKQIKQFIATFKKFDVNSDGFIDFDELKRMMEQMGEPQTHLSLKSMIAQIDDDHDNRINLREFLRIFQMSVNGQLADNSGLRALADRTTCDVTKEGVVGAADFFQSKIEMLTRGSQFEEEIKLEQAARRQEDEEKRKRRQLFLANRDIFK